MDFALVWLIRLALVALLFMPLIYSSSTVYPFVVGKALYSRALIETAFALWILLAVRRPEYRPGRSWLTLVFSLFVIATLISAIFGVSFQRSIWSNWERMQGVWDLFHWLLFLVLLLSVVKGFRQWRLLFSLNLGVGLLITLLGVYETNGWQWSIFQFLDGNNVSRMIGSLGNSVYTGAFGMVMAITAMGLFANLFKDESRPTKPKDTQRRRRRQIRRSVSQKSTITQLNMVLGLFYIIAALSGLWLIFESASRGAMVGFLAGITTAGLAYAVWGKQLRLRAIAAAATSLLMIAVLFFLILRTTTTIEGLRGASLIFERTIIDSANPDAPDKSLTDRSAASRIGIEAFLERPIVGWGIENYRVPWNLYLRGQDLDYPVPEFDNAHNKNIEILSTTGIVGAVPYAAFWILILWLMLRSIRQRPDQQLFTVFATGAVVAFWVQLYFLFDTSSTFMLLMMLGAYAGSTEKDVEEKSNQHLHGDILMPSQTRPALGEKLTEPEPVSLGFLPIPVSLGTLASLVVIPLLIYGLYSMHWRAWDAAKNVFSTRILVETGRDPELLSKLGQFDQLGTTTREWMIKGTSFEKFPEEFRLPVLAILEKEIEIALEAEPLSLSLNLAAADFYRRAAGAIPSARADLLILARKYSEKTLALGPETFGAFEDRIRQSIAERDLKKSREAVTLWKKKKGLATWLRYDFDDELAALEDLLFYSEKSD